MTHNPENTENRMLTGNPPDIYTDAEEQALDARAAEIAREWLEGDSPDLDRITGLIEANAASLAPLILGVLLGTNAERIDDAIMVLHEVMLDAAGTDWYADARALAEVEYLEINHE